jgi:2'-5' RNA ligase
MKTRTFIAVPLAPDICRRALDVIRQLQAVAGDVKWVDSDHMHWTLQFLGDVKDLELPAVCAGAFPSADRPRTLWLGAGEGADEMIALQAALDRSLAQLGFRGEQRRYTPHVTLGRAGRSAPPRALATELAALADFPVGTMLIDEVTIFASTLSRTGPEYRIIAHAPLA